MRYVVQFDRLGRYNHLSREIEAGNPVDLTYAISRLIRGERLLVSREFDVELIDERSGEIDNGRFGTFTYEVQP